MSKLYPTVVDNNPVMTKSQRLVKQLRLIAGFISKVRTPIAAAQVRMLKGAASRIEELERALKVALDSADCDSLHHGRGDYHTELGVCPVIERLRAALRGDACPEVEDEEIWNTKE